MRMGKGKKDRELIIVVGALLGTIMGTIVTTMCVELEIEGQPAGK